MNAVQKAQGKDMAEKEILTSDQVLQVPFRYSAGEVASRFLIALRDEEAIYGIRCPGCNKVYVPPRAICASCFRENTDWVKLSGEGKIESFTEIHYSETTHPLEAPFVMGIVKLDGADTGMLHLLKGASPADLKIGRRVKAVFADQRIGHIMDLSHFQVVD